MNLIKRRALNTIDEVDTLGGYTFSKINRSNTGEVSNIDNLYQFEIIDADPRKIKKSKFKLV